MFGAWVGGFADPPCGCHHVALMLEGTGFLVTALGAVVVDAVGLVPSAFGCLNLFPIDGNRVAECNV